MRKPEPEKVWTPEDVAAEMAQMVDRFTPMLEAVTGYRRQCIDAGFSEVAAEQMAVQMHGMLFGAKP